MMPPTTWSLELDVREDAPSMFVRAELLPDAVPGDLVEATSSDASTTHYGRVVDDIDDAQRGRFVVVSFEER